MKIYHNPRCSKSRETLNIILEHNIKPEIHLYLNDPLSTEEIKYILKLLKISADQIIRTLIEMINKNPILLERPIVVSKSQAIIGRPPENVRQLISNIA